MNRLPLPSELRQLQEAGALPETRVKAEELVYITMDGEYLCAGCSNVEAPKGLDPERPEDKQWLVVGVSTVEMESDRHEREIRCSHCGSELR